jgi:GNAT superfamily N-acetyltransferase
LRLSDFIFKPLTESLDVSLFSCGDDNDDVDISNFLKEDALNYQRDNMANTYLFVDEKDIIAAYFSISNDCLNDLGVEENLQNKIWNKFHKKAKIPNHKRIRSYPAIKIGRLGVAKHCQCTGLAYELMDFIKVYSITDIKPACRLLTLDAYNKERQIKYYKKNGFDFLKETDANESKRAMFFNLDVLR